MADVGDAKRSYGHGDDVIMTDDYEQDGRRTDREKKFSVQRTLTSLSGELVCSDSVCLNMVSFVHASSLGKNNGRVSYMKPIFRGVLEPGP